MGHWFLLDVFPFQSTVVFHGDSLKRVLGLPFQVFGSEAAEGQKQLFLRKGWSLVSGWVGGWSSMKKSLGRKPISQRFFQATFCLVSMQNHKWHKSKTM